MSSDTKCSACDKDAVITFNGDYSAGFCEEHRSLLEQISASDLLISKYATALLTECGVGVPDDPYQRSLDAEWNEREELEPEPDDPDYIYVIEQRPGVVKIGRSNDPERRLQDMQVASPEPMELLVAVEHPDVDIAESRLHDEFADDRLNGEWFDIGEDRRDALIDRLSGLQTLAGSGGADR